MLFSLLEIIFKYAFYSHFTEILRNKQKQTFWRPQEKATDLVQISLQKTFNSTAIEETTHLNFSL